MENRNSPDRKRPPLRHVTPPPSFSEPKESVARAIVTLLKRLPVAAASQATEGRPTP